ncbi:MAG TPA: hypothetical protein IAA26_08370 [Candidatus Blautia faecipullorum]|nr:hypothetical protein [Candidatus Blautia faecipullorum]
MEEKTGGYSAVFIDNVGNHEKNSVYRVLFLGLSTARRSPYKTPGRLRLRGCESA